MKRLTLQDLRTFVYKKGRLLYGAVFLFCLVLLYGLYRTYGENIQSSTPDSTISDGRKSLSDSMKKRQATAVSSEIANTSAYTTNGSSDAKWSDDGAAAPRGRQVYSLNKSLRPLPFEDPFFITLNGKNSLGDGTDDGRNGKSGKSATDKSNNKYDRTQQNNVRNRSNQYTRGGNGNSSSSGSGNGNYTRGTNSKSGKSGPSSRTAVNNNLILLGIVQGNKTLAMIQVNGEDGIYAVGEGNGQIYVKSIGSNSAVVVVNGVERRLYVQ